MDVFEAIHKRRSIRKYTDQPVEWDKVVHILEAGRLAPNAGNLCNFKFVAVREDAIRKLMAKACYNQEWMEQAPIHIMVCTEPDKSKRFYGLRGERFYVIQDCAAAAENMLIAATALGLGSCWVSAFDEERLRRIHNLPEQVIVQMVITIGYPAEEPEMPPKNTLEWLTFVERWGQKKNLPPSTMGWWSVRLERGLKEGEKGIRKLIQKLLENWKKKKG
ncbi:TPA: nitroreductase family protein [Candidatus Woesearchaeota archaeon]|nr:nitroreductase family protein [Candidatus Woesearchaeota archaeon]HII68627.1 nitroreductase family protein [Candidatus Woesearchaeota archaeon]